MSLIRKISISSRMNAAMALTALTLVLLGGGGYLAVSRAQRDFEFFTQQHLPSVVAVNNARQAIGHLARFDETDVVINYSVPSEAERHTQAWQTLLRQAVEPLQELSGRVDAQHAQAIKQAQDKLKIYERKVFPVFQMTMEGKLQSVSAGKKALEGAKQQIHDAEAALTTLGQQLEAATQTMGNDITARNSANSRTLAIAVPVALALLLPLMWATLRSVLHPLVQAREVASRIARGELSVEIIASGHDETADLLRSLAEMQEGLRTLVNGIRETASFVTTASNEMVAGNLDLSQRTETTASGLEAASSGITHLNDSLVQSARSANEADQLATRAAEVTVAGGTTVDEVARIMSGIEQSSLRIAEIVEVVDGIAKRTNILALNAGVEAARAGDQGRGFAIVAKEVRTLAHGVAESAREIKVLVEQASTHVEKGMLRVREAGATMGGAVESAHAVSRVVQHISAAISEQSHEMARVTDAVSQLDRLTQQNSALVEQSAAAAAGLRDRAMRLESLVGVFKLGQAPEPHGSARGTA